MGTLNKKQLERIRNECFWDLEMDVSKNHEILLSENRKDKKRLFEKILLNSTALLLVLQLFSKDELHEFLDSYDIPTFKKDFIFRKKTLLRFFSLTDRFLSRSSNGQHR